MYCFLNINSFNVMIMPTMSELHKKYTIIWKVKHYEHRNSFTEKKITVAATK
jgi:hypothetical protein